MEKINKKKRFFLFMVSFVGVVAYGLVSILQGKGIIFLSPLLMQTINVVGYLLGGLCILLLLLPWAEVRTSTERSYVKYFANSMYICFLVLFGGAWLLTGVEFLCKIPIWITTFYRVCAILTVANAGLSLVVFATLSLKKA